MGITLEKTIEELETMHKRGLLGIYGIKISRILKLLRELQERRKLSEITYCKDCEHYGRKDKRRFYRGYDCLEGRIATIVPDRDFCSRAERRTDGQPD